MRFIRKQLYHTKSNDDIGVSRFILNKETSNLTDNNREIIRVMTSIENELKNLNKNLSTQTAILNDIKNTSRLYVKNWL